MFGALGFRALGLGFRVQGLGFRLEGLEWGSCQIGAHAGAGVNMHGAMQKQAYDLAPL